MRRNLWMAGLSVAALAVAAVLVPFPWRPKKLRRRRRPRAQAATLTAEQARREVRLLDDLYKAAIIYMNEVYVEDANSVAAGETARDMFAAMKAKGWHDARLIDATGEPLNEENRPKNAFEKAAVAKILGGETYYDQVVREDGGAVSVGGDARAGHQRQVRHLSSGQQGGRRARRGQLSHPHQVEDVRVAGAARLKHALRGPRRRGFLYVPVMWNWRRSDPSLRVAGCRNVRKTPAKRPPMLESC